MNLPKTEGTNFIADELPFPKRMYDKCVSTDMDFREWFSDHKKRNVRLMDASPISLCISNNIETRNSYASYAEKSGKSFFYPF